MNFPFANLSQFNIILASNSPRRKDLLDNLGLKFKVKTLSGIDESYPKEMEVQEIALFLAKKKASYYLNDIKSNDLIITADTVVISNHQILGKPYNRNNAIEMIKQLSAKTHQVITGVCLTSAKKTIAFSCTTDVTFAELTQQEINYYVDHYTPYDKAGSYGIQEWIGYIGVEKINGSFFNVMGLPIQKLFQVLKTI